jgi:ligand-binding SRPBCC domain-containing protein
VTGRLSPGARPDRELTRVHCETTVPAPLDETFAFFADASNLQRITPSWLHFSIATPPPLVLQQDVEIEYRIRVHGVPFRWTSRIDIWEPGVRFVDRQVAGPYRWWRHEHRFEPAGDATRVIDDVEYVPRAAWLTASWVRRDVERIFAFRQNALREIFGSGHRRE